ncbi:MAG: DUF3127 domain-containing protein, partial [Bacteroidota bacterium]
TNQLKITGTIINIQDAIQGESWIKQAFQIRTDGEYPKLVSFITFNACQDQLSRCKIDDQVNVYFNPESRSHNEKWYTELTAWRININFKK